MWQLCITAPDRIMSWVCSAALKAYVVSVFRNLVAMKIHAACSSTTNSQSHTVQQLKNTIILATPTTPVISIVYTCHNSICMAESNCTSRVSRLSCCVSGLWMLTLAVCAGSLLMSSRCLRSLSHSFLNSVLRLYFRQKENAYNTHNSSMAHQLKWTAATVELSNRSVQNITVCQTGFSISSPNSNHVPKSSPKFLLRCLWYRCISNSWYCRWNVKHKRSEKAMLQPRLTMRAMSWYSVSTCALVRKSSRHWQ
jgi:hypothetical protein